MPPRSEEELDAVTLHNQVGWILYSDTVSLYTVCSLIQLVERKESTGIVRGGHL